MPQTPTTQALAPADAPNGAWRHPQFDEMARRRYATTFDHQNVHTIVANAALLLLSVYGHQVTAHVTPLEYAAAPINAVIALVPYSSYVTLAIRLLFFVNIALNLLPLVRRYYPDDMTDIPLTPSQRAAMGLKTAVGTTHTPASACASPNYVTPPRYQRSTPRSNSFSSQDRPAGLARSSSASPFSPATSMNTSSPLFQRAMGSSAAKRLSYGSSDRGSGLFGDSPNSATPSTPTPSTGKASVSLNNKWLYDKRRDSPRSSLFS